MILYSQQERTKLEQDKKKVEEDIEYTNKLLSQTRKSKTASINELVILDKRISQREELIDVIQLEISYLQRKIRTSQDSIKLLNDELEQLRDEYAAMIYYAYKNKNMYDRMMFLFAAEDFNQAYQRLKYFQQYNAYRKKQAELIDNTQKQLEKRVAALEQARAEKSNLLESAEDEKEKLIAEKNEKDQTVQSLTRQEKDLQKTLKEKEKAAKQLSKAIEKIIAEEIRLANERANADKTKKDFSLTPDEIQLTADFVNNKGQLPWPLERGIISSTFGEHPHPVLKKVKVRNNGIDILTGQNAEARAVFEGEVTRVMSVPNNNNVVIIRHGEYLTVYANLDKVHVKQGDKVSTRQPIGIVFTNPDESKTELHFEVWKAKVLQNPSSWLARKQ
jgi:septal ring factor EnvC (AmiA/AmiB activator)